jgi:hypothetical protein
MGDVVIGGKGRDKLNKSVRPVHFFQSHAQDTFQAPLSASFRSFLIASVYHRCRLPFYNAKVPLLHLVYKMAVVLETPHPLKEVSCVVATETDLNHLPPFPLQFPPLMRTGRCTTASSHLFLMDRGTNRLLQ